MFDDIVNSESEDEEMVSVPKSLVDAMKDNIKAKEQLIDKMMDEIKELENQIEQLTEQMVK